MSSSGTALLLQPRVKVRGEYHIKEKQYLLLSFNRPACLLCVAIDTAKYLEELKPVPLFVSQELYQ
jgi:hypothetical protein